MMTLLRRYCLTRLGQACVGRELTMEGRGGCSGFTLVELLAVVAIMSVVLTVSSVVFRGSLNDVNKGYSMVMADGRLLTILGLLERDVDAASGLRIADDEPGGGGSTIVIEQADRIVTYRWADSVLCRDVVGRESRSLDAAAGQGEGDPNDCRLQSGSMQWVLGEVNMSWGIREKGDRGYALEVHKSIRAKGKKPEGYIPRDHLANTYVFFAGAGGRLGDEDAKP